MSATCSADQSASFSTDEEAQRQRVHQSYHSFMSSTDGIPTPPETGQSSATGQDSAIQEQEPYTASLSREASSSEISNKSIDRLAHPHKDHTMEASTRSLSSRKRRRSHDGCSERSSGSSSVHLHSKQSVTNFKPRHRDFVKSNTWSSLDLRPGASGSPASLQQARNVVHSSPNNLFSPSKAPKSMPFRRHHSSAAIMAGPRSDASGSTVAGEGNMAPGLAAEGFGMQVLPDGQVRPYVRRNVLQMVFRGTRLWTHEPIYYEDSETSHSSGGEEEEDDDEEEDDWNVSDELRQEASQTSEKRSKISSASFDWRQYGDYFGERPPTSARRSEGPPTTPPPSTSHAAHTAAHGKAAAEPPRVKDSQQNAKNVRRLMARREWENNRLANPRLKPKRLFVKEIREVERRKLREMQQTNDERARKCDRVASSSTSSDALLDPDWVLGRIATAPDDTAIQQRQTVKPTIASQHGQMTPPRSQESQQYETEAQRKRFDSAMTLEGSDEFLDARSWDPPSVNYANAGRHVVHGVAQQNAFNRAAAPAYQQPWPAAAAPGQSTLPPLPWARPVHASYHASNLLSDDEENQTYESDQIHQSDRKAAVPRTIYNSGRATSQPFTVLAGSQNDDDLFSA